MQAKLIFVAAVLVALCGCMAEAKKKIKCKKNKPDFSELTGDFIGCLGEMSKGQNAVLRCVIKTKCGMPADEAKCYKWVKDISPPKKEAVMEAEMKKCSKQLKACKPAEEDADAKTCQALNDCIQNVGKKCCSK